jgi:CRP-like cAMP-binding protein
MSTPFIRRYSVQESCNLFMANLQKHALHRIPECVSRAIISKMSVEYFKKGAFFCSQGDEHTRAGMLLNGAAKAFSIDENNQKSLIKFFCSREMIFDEHAEDGSISDRFIEFVCASGVVVINDLPELTGIFVRENLFPDILHVYMGFYKEELHSIECLSQIRNIQDARMRIAGFYKKFPDMDRYFSGGDIAALIGLSRETFSRYRNEVLKGNHA